MRAFLSADGFVPSIILTAFAPAAIASRQAWTFGAIPSANVALSASNSVAEIVEMREDLSGQFL